MSNAQLQRDVKCCEVFLAINFAVILAILCSIYYIISRVPSADTKMQLIVTQTLLVYQIAVHVWLYFRLKKLDRALTTTAAATAFVPMLPEDDEESKFILESHAVVRPGDPSGVHVGREYKLAWFSINTDLTLSARWFLDPGMSIGEALDNGGIRVVADGVGTVIAVSPVKIEEPTVADFFNERMRISHQAGFNAQASMRSFAP